MNRKTLLLGLALSTLSACASDTPHLKIPPRVPALFHANPAPHAPLAPEGILIPQVAMPEAPPSRLQRVEEVFGESYALDAIPERWPIDPTNVIVTSVPQATSPDLRNALIGGFLSAGYEVKDAGKFIEGAFQVSASTPLSLAAFHGKALIEASAGNGAPTEFPEQPGAPALEAMSLHLDDPTSLWIPDLLALENLNADYFLRVFELTLEETEAEVGLTRITYPLAVEHFNAEVFTANELIKNNARRIRRFEDLVQDYEQRYSNYEDAYTKWYERDRTENLERMERYERNWNTWRRSQSETIAALKASGQNDARWERPEPTPKYQAPTPPAPYQRREVPAIQTALDTSDIQATLEEVVHTSVPCRRVHMIAQVVQASNGQVIWAGEVKGQAPLTVPASEVLRRAVRHMLDQ